MDDEEALQCTPAQALTCGPSTLQAPPAPPAHATAPAPAHAPLDQAAGDVMGNRPPAAHPHVSRAQAARDRQLRTIVAQCAAQANMGRTHPVETCSDTLSPEMQACLESRGVMPRAEDGPTIGPADPNTPMYDPQAEADAAAAARGEHVDSPQVRENTEALGHLTQGGPFMTAGEVGMLASGRPITTERVNQVGAVAEPMDEMTEAVVAGQELREQNHESREPAPAIVGHHALPGPAVPPVPEAPVRELPPRNIQRERAQQRHFTEVQRQRARAHVRAR
jgi:hypothetical protein